MRIRQLVLLLTFQSVALIGVVGQTHFTSKPTGAKEVIPTVRWNEEKKTNDDDLTRADRYNYENVIVPNLSVKELSKSVRWHSVDPDSVASLDIVVRGVVLASRAHLSTNNRGLYTTLSILVDDVFKSSDSTADVNKIIELEMPGGAVLFPSGKRTVVVADSLEFPQLGHTYLFLGKKIQASSWQLLQTLAAVNGSIRISNHAAPTEYDKQLLSAVVSAYPIAIDSLIGTEDHSQVLFDINQHDSATDVKPYRNRRYNAASKYLPESDGQSRVSIGRVVVGDAGPPFPVFDSDTVVLATVGSMTTHLTGDQTGIYTTYELKVDRVFPHAPSKSPAGMSEGQKIEVEIGAGKAIDQYGIVRLSQIYGVGLLTPGLQYVIFLRRTDSGDSWSYSTSYRVLDGKIYANNRRFLEQMKLDGTSLSEFEAILHRVESGDYDISGRKK